MSESEREANIRRLLPMVKRIARRVALLVPADIDDLIGDGSIGLIRAVDHYDPSYGSSLSSYANKLILGAMLNGLRRLDPVSERVRRTVRQAEQRRHDLAQERGEMPTMAELERDDPALKRARTQAFCYTPASLDASLVRNSDALADADADPSIEALARAKRREIAQAVALLPERQRRVLALHYGSERSLRSIGRELRISPQRASQLHLQALERLRRSLGTLQV